MAPRARIACWICLLGAAASAVAGCAGKSEDSAEPDGAAARQYRPQAYWIRKPFAIAKRGSAPDSLELIRARDATRRERSSFSPHHMDGIKSEAMLAHCVRRFAQITHYVILEVAPAREDGAAEYGYLDLDDSEAAVQWCISREQVDAFYRRESGSDNPIPLGTFEAGKPTDVLSWVYACIPMAAASLVMLLATMRLTGHDRLRLMLAGLALTAAAEAAVQWYFISYSGMTMCLSVMAMVLGALGLGHLFVGPTPQVRVLLPASVMTIGAMAVGGVFATIAPALLLELILFG